MKPTSDLLNKYNRQFFSWIGGSFTFYDPNNETYIEKGYNKNPIVNAIVNQMATKTGSVPYYIREVKDKKAKKSLDKLLMSTKGDLSPSQHLKKYILETKAFNEDEIPFPMERPNINQTWTEFWILYKTFISLTGNAYMYIVSPENGANKGKPLQVYWLPSHLIQIIIKDNAKLLLDEDPIRGYMVTFSDQSFNEFDSEDVIHIKYANPNFGMNGEHLYGMSPLRAALRNIESSNDSLDLNIKTMKSGGAFGFIHGKSVGLTETQATAIKDKLTKMNNSHDALSRIQGASAELGFTKVGLTNEELQTFEMLKFDQKQIANVLRWDDKLLNNDDGAKFDNINIVRKRVISDNIVPDLKLLTDALNRDFLPRFKGFENTVLVFDVMELPEMQQDKKMISEWVKPMVDIGVLNKNEGRLALGFSLSEDKDMDIHTVATDIISLKDALDNDFSITPSE